MIWYNSKCTIAIPEGINQFEHNASSIEKKWKIILTVMFVTLDNVEILVRSCTLAMGGDETWY